MKKIIVISVTTMLSIALPAQADYVKDNTVYTTPPPGVIVDKNPPPSVTSKTGGSYSPVGRKYEHLINKAPGEEGSEEYEYERYSRNYDSADCGLKVNVNPFKLLNEDFDGLVSWSSRKCPDEEKLETIRQNGQTRRTEINRDRDIAVTTIEGDKQVAAKTVEQCLNARTQALNVGYDPEQICLLQLIYDLTDK